MLYIKHTFLTMKSKGRDNNYDNNCMIMITTYKNIEIFYSIRKEYSLYIHLSNLRLHNIKRKNLSLN